MRPGRRECKRSGSQPQRTVDSLSRILRQAAEVTSEEISELRVMAHPLRLRLMSLMTEAAMSGADAALYRQVETGRSRSSPREEPGAGLSAEDRDLFVHMLIAGLLRRNQLRAGVGQRWMWTPNSGCRQRSGTNMWQ